MPLIRVDLVRGRLDAAKRRALGAALIEAVMAAEGVPDSPEARMMSWVLFNELPGDAWLAAEGQNARYLVELLVPQGLLTDEGKAVAVARVSDAIQAAEGPDVFLAGMGPWVIIREVPDGNWGAAGQVVRRDRIGAALHAFKESHP